MLQPVIAAAGYGYTLLLLGSACGQRLIGGGLNTDLQLGFQENHMKPGDASFNCCSYTEIRARWH